MPHIFSSEFVQNYNSYSFGYTHYATRIPGEFLDDIYNKGFLPYTGEVALADENLFYMARSVRVVCSRFLLTSENRRVLKKISREQFYITEKPASEFLNNTEMISFCLNYFLQKHGEGTMSEGRLKKILGYFPETWVIEYRNKLNMVCAYVIEVRSRTMAHYWFSFFSIHETYPSFGMWLMLDRTLSAQEIHLDNYYLGTLYYEKSLYKANISGLEYWDGSFWNADLKKLSHRAKTDHTRFIDLQDEFKDSRDNPVLE